MRWLPRSLYGRLLALSLVATAAALVLAAFAIGGVLERFVVAGLDDRLDGEIAILATAVNRDGAIDAHRAVVAMPYADLESGWWWRIDAPVAHLASPGAPATVPAGHERPPHHDGPGPPGPPGLEDDDRPTPFDWHDDRGERRHGRRLTIATAAGPATLVAAAPRAIVERPIRAAMAPLIGSLAALGVALALASLVQLRLGLAPLARLRRSVVAIRAGDADRLPADQPTELAPLAAELDALVAENAARLDHARGHVANLAHGLKTPLATLSLALGEPGRDPDGRLATEVARINAAIRHHLGRARADAAGSVGAAIALAPAVEALAEALSRIHADRPIAFAADMPTDLHLAIDAQDLDELLGNLLDNGWRWARSRLTLTATRDGRLARIAIADDGPGIAREARAAALARGQRLDETGEGYGFGLSIAAELAALHGGSLALEESEGGGLTAIVRLPARALPAA